MKVIIAGSRKITDIAFVMKAIGDSGFKIDELVCGMAPGVDSLGLMWAKSCNRLFPHNPILIKEFPAQWGDLRHPEAVLRQRPDGSYYNANAGPIRNSQMANYADALILVWDGKSKGSADMLKKATARKLKIHQYVV